MEEGYHKKSDTDAEPDPAVEVYSGEDAEKTKSIRKSPLIAALLSLVVPGLGQVYAGDLFRGFAIIAGLGISLCLMALIIGLITFPAIWIFGVIDAYKMIKKQNDKIGACS